MKQLTIQKKIILWFSSLDETMNLSIPLSSYYSDSYLRDDLCHRGFCLK